MFEVIIVGSGVSGVAAALRLVDNGIKPCIIDVGMEPCPEPEISENFYSYREKNDCFKLMIGEDFEGLYNLDRRNKPIPAKLTSPRMRFVLERSKELAPVNESGFNVIQSFALGGLANAWGAGLYRYNNRDLEGFPIRESDLSPYYERLTKEIGISGENDDLTPYFDRDDFLQKPLRLSANASRILKKYFRNRKKLNKKGIYVGRPRLGVLSEEKDGRKACDYSNLEFWQPDLSYIYSPSFTLRKLIQEGKVVYIKGFMVKSWSRKDNVLNVQADSVKEKKAAFFECKKLVLAAGAVNSAKLALSTAKDYQTKLTLLDNPALQFPFVLPGRIGSILETDAFGLTQLNFIYDSKVYNMLLHGSILEVTSPARAEFFAAFPLAAFDNLRLTRTMLPALVVMQLFLPASREQGALLSLDENEELKIFGKANEIGKDLITDIIKIFRILGGYTLPSLVIRVPNGHGIHYAGTLPMSDSPKSEYTCSKFGELYGEPDVFVIDGSVFPALAAKNSSFSVMANAMRIADFITNTLRG